MAGDRRINFGAAGEARYRIEDTGDGANLVLCEDLDSDTVLLEYDDATGRWSMAADLDVSGTAVRENLVLRGTLAERPASGGFTDQLYLATDDDTLYRWDGSSWVEAISGGGGGGAFEVSGDVLQDTTSGVSQLAIFGSATGNGAVAIGGEMATPAFPAADASATAAVAAGPGAVASGMGAIAGPIGTASGNTSFAASNATASGNSSFAGPSGAANADNSFAAIDATVDSGANDSVAFGPGLTVTAADTFSVGGTLTTADFGTTIEATGTIRSETGIGHDTEEDLSQSTGNFNGEIRLNDGTVGDPGPLWWDNDAQVWQPMPTTAVDPNA